MPLFSDAVSIRYGSQAVTKIMQGTTQVWPINALNLYHYSQHSDAYVAANPSLIKTTRNPQASWLGNWVTNPQSEITADKAAAAGKTLHYVLYAIPFRDNGNYSSGGFTTDQEYFNWIDSVVAGIGNYNCIIILEPDAPGLVAELSTADQDRRYNLLATAVTKLKQNPNTKVFIDIGYWVSPANAATSLLRANIAAADGHSINVSNFQTTAYCHARSEEYATALANLGITNKKYIIDTSRNGNGPLTTQYPNSAPWFNTNQDWCNPPGRALGLAPQIPAAYPNCYAYLWVKNTGDSDGTFPTTAESSVYTANAPAAGTFWLEYALMLCNNTP